MTVNSNENMGEEKKLSVKGLTLVGGTAWALFILVIGILNIISPEYGGEFLRKLSSIYPGYKTRGNFIDLMIGVFSAFLSGAIWGFIFCLLYNAFASKDRRVAPRRNMRLLGPTEADKKKIHDEVNQIVNQRFVLTTLAVTVFGVILTWLTWFIIKNPLPEPQGNCVSSFIYIASILLMVVLFSLFLLSHRLAYMLRVFTTYLDVTGSSNWEKDWIAYRKRFRYHGYTKSESMVFLLLGLIATSFPFLLCLLVFHSKIKPSVGTILPLIMGTAYIIFVLGMSWGGWFTKEKSVRDNWEELNKTKKQ